MTEKEFEELKNQNKIRMLPLNRCPKNAEIVAVFKGRTRCVPPRIDRIVWKDKNGSLLSCETLIWD